MSEEDKVVSWIDLEKDGEISLYEGKPFTGVRIVRKIYSRHSGSPTIVKDSSIDSSQSSYRKLDRGLTCRV